MLNLESRNLSKFVFGALINCIDRKMLKFGRSRKSGNMTQSAGQILPLSHFPKCLHMWAFKKGHLFTGRHGALKHFKAAYCIFGFKTQDPKGLQFSIYTMFRTWIDVYVCVYIYTHIEYILNLFVK